MLAAYRHQCAFCCVQLGLLDAAHIIPVSAPGSTDEVANGVALCKLHHSAYDANLIAFDRQYKIHISKARLKDLSAANLSGGFKGFRDALGISLALPVDPKNYPNPTYVQSALKVRGWRP
ncbi:HNH endonuclease [Ralstonia mannitolilytica]|uniref:HNH endonuclease n=1 Tax=Ralstonia mannitolilytica TaxID=105219 RepID=UPI003741E91E